MSFLPLLWGLDIFCGPSQVPGRMEGTQAGASLCHSCIPSTLKFLFLPRPHPLPLHYSQTYMGFLWASQKHSAGHSSPALLPLPEEICPRARVHVTKGEGNESVPLCNLLAPGCWIPEAAPSTCFTTHYLFCLCRLRRLSTNTRCYQVSTCFQDQLPLKNA